MTGMLSIRKVSKVMKERITKEIKLLNECGSVLAELYQFLGGVYIGRKSKNADIAEKYMDEIISVLNKLDKYYDTDVSEQYYKTSKIYSIRNIATKEKHN
jgi:hypothetical protein